MVIRVKVQTRAASERIEEIGLEEYKIWTTAAPTDNEANESVKDILAEHFNTSPSKIHIRSGHKSTHKLIEIG